MLWTLWRKDTPKEIMRRQRRDTLRTACSEVESAGRIANAVVKIVLDSLAGDLIIQS